MLPVSQSHQAFSWHPPLCALVLFGAIAFGSTTRAFAQKTPPQTQTQTGASSAGQTPADQAPSAPAPPAPVALYNLLESKSIVFPDVAYSTERLWAGQEFELFVDNSVSVGSVTQAGLDSAVGREDDFPAGFGQGWEGYGKRFRSSMGPGRRFTGGSAARPGGRPDTTDCRGKGWLSFSVRASK